jgi:hypothetical protein
LNLGILLVLAIAGLQKLPVLFLRGEPRKIDPLIQSIVGQLQSILLVGLGTP